MKEGLALLVRYAFDELELHRLEANIQPQNLTSIALAKSVGFQYEGYSPRYLKINGEWCDHERWAILADQE
jgi:ribosomal-protein-alanine N-acetyltransferase